MITKKQHILSTSLALVINPIVCLSQVHNSNEIQLDSAITKVLAKNQLAAISASVVVNNRIAWANAYGYANIEGQIKAQPSTVFHQGSVSKTTTSAALLQLLHDKSISLDDSINKYLDFKISNPGFADTPITFRMLITHTASLSDRTSTGNKLSALYGSADSDDSLGTVLKELLCKHGKRYSNGYFLKQKPGTKYEYSNLGYSIIGYLVQKISGKPFNEYVKETLFRPTGMTTSTYLLRETDTLNFAFQYANLQDERRKVKPFTWPGYPDGSLRISALDYSHFLMMLMNNGYYKSNKVLNETAVESILSPQHIAELPAGNLAPINDISLGWTIIDINGEHFYSHNGFGAGFFSMVYFDPALRIGGCLFITGEFSTFPKMREEIKAIWVAMLQFSKGELEKPEEQLSQKLYKHVAFFASDSLAGRKIGSTGFAKAEKYSEGLFKENGLLPLFALQETGNPYRQPIQITERNYADSSKFEITYNSTIQSITSNQLKYVSLTNDSLFQKNFPLIYINYWPPDSEKQNRNIDLTDKIAIVEAIERSAFDSTESVNTAITRTSDLADKSKPKGIILIANSAFESIWPKIHNAIRQPAYVPGINLPHRISLFSTDLILLKPEAGKILLREVDKIKKQNSATAIQLSNTTITYSSPHTDSTYQSWNLGGYFRGSDSLLSNEFIVVGAHLDHLGIVNGQVMNGADDNASGSAALIELINRIKYQQHKRSIAFILWTGEESEALGSQQFLARAPIPSDKIKWYVNFDMVGRIAPENEQTGAIYISTSDNLIRPIKQAIDPIATQSKGLPIEYTTNGLSDHFCFMANGIPSFSFYSGHHADVHQPTDDIEKLDFLRMARVVEMASKIVIKLSNE